MLQSVGRLYGLWSSWFPHSTNIMTSGPWCHRFRSYFTALTTFNYGTGKIGLCPFAPYIWAPLHVLRLLLRIGFCSNRSTFLWNTAEQRQIWSWLVNKLALKHSSCSMWKAELKVNTDLSRWSKEWWLLNPPSSSSTGRTRGNHPNLPRSTLNEPVTRQLLQQQARPIALWHLHHSLQDEMEGKDWLGRGCVVAFDAALP